MLNIVDGHTHLGQSDGTLENNIDDYFKMTKEQGISIDNAVVCLSPYQVPDLFRNSNLTTINPDFSLKDVHSTLDTDIIPYFFVPYTPGSSVSPKWIENIDYSEYVSSLKNAGFKGLKFHCKEGFDRSIYGILNAGLDVGMSIQVHINNSDKINDTLEKGEFSLSRIIEETTQSGNIFYGVHGADIIINSLPEEKYNNDIMKDPMILSMLKAGKPIEGMLEELEPYYAEPIKDIEFEKYQKLIQTIEDNLGKIYLGSSENEYGRTQNYFHSNNNLSIQSKKLCQMIGEESEILKHIVFESDIYGDHTVFDNHTPIIQSTILRQVDKDNILYHNGLDYVNKIA